MPIGVGPRLASIPSFGKPVSSNTHAIANLLGGTILRARSDIQKFIRASNDPELLVEYNKLVSGEVQAAAKGQ